MAEAKGEYGKGMRKAETKVAGAKSTGESKGAKSGAKDDDADDYETEYSSNTKFLEPADGKPVNIAKEAMASVPASLEEEETAPVLVDGGMIFCLPPQGFIGIAASPEAKQIGSGFKVNWMNMRDAYTGKMLWEQKTGWDNMYEEEIIAHVPSTILRCRAVLLHEHPFEEWLFNFGFVMPSSTNTWQQVIEAASEMVPAEILNGNVVIETSFLDGDTLIARCRVRVFYDV